MAFVDKSRFSGRKQVIAGDEGLANVRAPASRIDKAAPRAAARLNFRDAHAKAILQ